MIRATFEYAYIQDGSFVYMTLIEHKVDIISDFELPGAARSRVTAYFVDKNHMYNVLYALNKESKERVSLVRYKRVKKN